MGHFQTNPTLYRCVSISLVLLKKLTFCTLRPASKSACCLAVRGKPRQRDGIN
jgi:hypothetical protein